MDKSRWEPQEGLLEEGLVNRTLKKNGGIERHSLRGAGEYPGQQREVWCSWSWAGGGRRDKWKRQPKPANRARLWCYPKAQRTSPGLARQTGLLVANLSYYLCFCSFKCQRFNMISKFTAPSPPLTHPRLSCLGNS